MEDTKPLRDTLSCYPTGVTVVTTIHRGEPVGVTINSYTPVTLEPPMALFCLSVTSRSFESFSHAEHFVINFLSETQSSVSHDFATSADDRWQNVDYESLSQSRCPALKETAGYLECRRAKMVEAGDHMIIMGEILSHHHDPSRKPLLYTKRNYHTLGRIIERKTP